MGLFSENVQLISGKTLFILGWRGEHLEMINEIIVIIIIIIIIIRM